MLMSLKAIDRAFAYYKRFEKWRKQKKIYSKTHNKNQKREEQYLSTHGDATRTDNSQSTPTSRPTSH